MFKNWKIKTLLFFLVLFILNNLENFIIGTVEFIVRIPLNLNSFMTNVVGTEVWSRIIHVTSNPILLIISGLLLSIIVIGVVRSLDFLKK